MHVRCVVLPGYGVRGRRGGGGGGPGAQGAVLRWRLWCADTTFLATGCRIQHPQETKQCTLLLCDLKLAMNVVRSPDLPPLTPGRALATLVRPRSEDLFLWSKDLFVRRRLRSDFRRFDPASPGDGLTLATLVRPRRRL